MILPIQHDNPEISALLAEVFNDPNAKLLKVPRFHAPVAMPEPVSPGAPFLTRAERHLLKAHRWEVASQVLQRCREVVLQGSNGSLVHSYDVREFEKGGGLHVGSSHSRVDRSPAERLDVSDEMSKAYDSLQDPSRDVTRLRYLASLASRLMDSPQGLFYQGVGAVKAGGNSDATRIFAKLKSNPLVGFRLRSLAAEWLGSIALSDCEYIASGQQYLDSVRLDATPGKSSMSAVRAFLAAIRFPGSTLARKATEALDLTEAMESVGVSRYLATFSHWGGLNPVRRSELHHTLSNAREDFSLSSTPAAVIHAVLQAL